MKRIFASTLIALCSTALWAAPITIKVASQAPENTPIGAGLARIAAEWKRISGGQLILRVFHNGTQGDEESMRQKMNTGLLDGALFDSFGLAHIAPEALSLCAPAVIADQEELDFVMTRAAPVIKGKMEDKGFRTLALTSIGWVRFYSRFAIAEPSDMRKYKIAVNPYEKELIQLYKLAGLNIVLTPITTMLQQLQARAVDIFYTTPMYLSFQWSMYKDVGSHMTDLKVCPVIGGIVLSKRAWEKIPESYRGEILKATESIAAEMSADFIKKENAIVADLARNGQKTVSVSAAAERAWRDEFARAVEKGTGTVFSKEMMDLIHAAQADFRKEEK